MQTQQPNTYTKEQFLTFYRMISPSIQEPPEHLKQFSLILSNKLLQPINETNLHLFDSDYNINPDISYPVPSTRGRGRGGRGGRRGGSITTVGRGSSSSLPFSTVGRGRGTSIGGVKSPLGSKLPAWALDEEENNNTNPLSNNNSTPPTTDDDTFGSGSKFEPVSLESLSAATLKMNESWKHLKQPSKDVSSNEALENLDLTWDSQWYYLTEENNEPKGPYSLSKLKEWLDFSYFQPDTRITQDVEAEDVFIIGDVIKKLQQQEEKNDNVTSDEIETSLTPNNNLTTLVVEEKKDDVNNFLTEKEITRSGLLSSVLSDVINEDQIKPTSSLLGSSSLVGNEKTPVTLPPTLNQPTTPTLQPQQPSIGFGGAWGYNQPMNHMVDNLPHHAFMNPQLPYSNIPPQHMGHHSFLPYPQNTHWMMGFGNMHSPQMPSVTEIESQFQNMLHQQHLMMSQANSQILQQQHMQHQQHLQQQQQPILQQPPLQQQTNIIPTATSPTAISPSVTPKVHDVNEITSLPPIVPVILNSEEESNLNIVENDISPKEIGESLEDKFEKSANKNKQTSKKKKEEKQTNQTKQKSSEKKQTKPKVETKVEPILTVKTEPVFRSLPPSESINFSNDVKEEKGWGSSIVVTKPTVPTLKEIMEEQKKEQENKKQQAEHKKKLEVEQAKKELQQQIQQQPLLGKTGWGATPITVQSNLKEIIEEETKKKKQSEQKKTVQQNQASVVKQSIWGAGSLPSSNTKESNTKFKSVPAPQGTTTTTFVSTPTKAVDKNQLNFQGIKAAPTVNPTTVKEEEDQEEMFWDTTPTTTNTANTTPKNEQKKSSKKKKNKGGNTATTQQSTEKKDEFPALSVPSNGKSNPFGQSDDVSQDFKEWFKKSVKKFKPVDNSFMYFLLSLNSEKEVVEYITEYLGDSAPVQKFAQEFIANKSFEGFKDVKKKK